MLRPSPTLARKDSGLNDGRRLIAIARASLPRVSKKRTFAHHKTFSTVSKFEQIVAQGSARLAVRPKEKNHTASPRRPFRGFRSVLEEDIIVTNRVAGPAKKNEMRSQAG